MCISQRLPGVTDLQRQDYERFGQMIRDNGIAVD